MKESDANKIYNHLKNIDIKRRKLAKKHGLIRWGNEVNLNGYAISANKGNKKFTCFLHNNLPFEIYTYNFKNSITEDSQKLLLNLIPAWKNKKIKIITTQSTNEKIHRTATTT